jgi:isocitrate dehydrogenase
VSVTIPASINVPIGGCSIPFIVDLQNNPVYDVSVIFNYANNIYNESVFWPNTRTTKSQLYFTKNVKENIVSFCVASNFGGLGLAASFVMKFVFMGTNYKSY